MYYEFGHSTGLIITFGSGIPGEGRSPGSRLSGCPGTGNTTALFVKFPPDYGIEGKKNELTKQFASIEPRNDPFGKNG
jgi:hypothetical protein